jgi:hypothetical protein
MDSVIATGAGIKIGDVRRALKSAARSGGSHIVQVDMHAPTEREAQAILDMAYGCEANRIHDWVRGEAWNRRAGRWYSRDRQDEVLDMRGASWINREDGYRGSMYHVAIYKRDEVYEARIAAWAERHLVGDSVCV